MSHCTMSHGVTFTHNADLSGDVTIRTGNGDLVQVPGAALIRLIAKHAMTLRVAKMEQMSDQDLLGLNRTDANQ